MLCRLITHTGNDVKCLFYVQLGPSGVSHIWWVKAFYSTGCEMSDVQDQKSKG